MRTDFSKGHESCVHFPKTGNQLNLGGFVLILHEFPELQF